MAPLFRPEVEIRRILARASWKQLTPPGDTASCGKEVFAEAQGDRTDRHLTGIATNTLSTNHINPSATSAVLW